MVGVASIFVGALRAFHQQADRVRAKRHRRGVKLRLPRTIPFGLLDVRHDELLGRAAAAERPAKASDAAINSGKSRRSTESSIPKAPGAGNRDAATPQIAESPASPQACRQYCLPVFDWSLARTAAQIHRSHRAASHLRGRIVVLVLFVLAHTVH